MFFAENLFLKCTDQDRVVKALQSYALECAQSKNGAPLWIPFDQARTHCCSIAAYPVTIKVSPARKTVSRSLDFPYSFGRADSPGKPEWEWVHLVAENDEVDLALARWLSRVLHTTCVAVFAHDGTGADTYGWDVNVNGELSEESSWQMEERPVARAEQHLQMLGVPYGMRSFEHCNGPNWRAVVIGQKS